MSRSPRPQDEPALDGIFTHALDAMLVADDDGRLVDANPAACELTGLARAELLSRSVSDLATPDQRPTVRSQWAEFLAAGRAEGIFTVLRHDGSVREAEFRAVAEVSPGRHLSVLRDVSERRRAERATADRDEWIDLVLEQLPAALWIVDRRLLVTFARGAGMTVDPGAPAPINAGRTVTGDASSVVDAHQRALAGEEVRYEGRTASRIWHCHVQPLRRRGGEIVGVVGIGLDVTEELRIRQDLADTLAAVRQLEAERRRLARDLRSSRDEERRRLARDLHDDLGQAVALIAIQARTLERDVPPELEDRLTELHDLAHWAAESTRRLVGQLRDEPAEDLTLRASLGRLAEEFEARHGVRIEVSVSGTAEDVPVTVAAVAHRIAREAVTNAVKHARPQVISIVTRAATDRLTLVVEDDGAGFDPTGVPLAARHGLTGMDELAREARGRLTVESAPGKGSVVRAELPLEGA